MAEVVHKNIPPSTQGPVTTSAGKAASERKSVFIVDDHTMFREGLRQLIDRESSLTVCGDAPDAAAARAREPTFS